MKLRSFCGRNVRGYLNFDLKFDESLNFLIGINGCGKTTVLRLLYGLVTPSLEELLKIQYSSLSLRCYDEVKNDFEIEIFCKKNIKSLTLQVIDVKSGETVEDSFMLSEIEEESDRFEEKLWLIDDIPRSKKYFENSKVVAKIREIQKYQRPLFLGLNRRIEGLNLQLPKRKSYLFYERERSEERVADSVIQALREIEDLIHDFVRENAKKQLSLSDEFRKKVFAESFRISPSENVFELSWQKDMKHLKEQRQQIRDAFEELKIKDLLRECDDFLDDVSKTLDTLSKLEKDWTSEKKGLLALTRWMMSKSQLDKIDKIIQYANEYRQNLQRISEPVTKFIESVNLFYKEVGKEILIDQKGDVQIRINGIKKSISMFELSSGEKQLLILMAHVAFYKKNRAKSFLIIDEPELSLHITWQEIFIDALLKASPETQYILATHAPSIVSSISRSRNCIDLSLNNEAPKKWN